MATGIGRIGAGDVAAGRFPGKIKALWASVERILAAIDNRRAAARYFSVADERTLHDIGLTPGDVEAAFSQPLWRDPTEHLGRVQRMRRKPDARAEPQPWPATGRGV